MNILFVAKRLMYNILPPPISKSLRYNKFVKDGINSEMWGGGIYKDNLQKAIEFNTSPSQREDKKYIIALAKDVIKSYLELEITPEEYFVWDFEHKKRKEREAYLPNMVKDKILLARTKPEHIERLKDKYKSYTILKDLYKRDLIMVSSESDRENYYSFISKHNKYFAKPLAGQCGKGAQVLENDHFEELLSQGQWIIEEIIAQDPRVAAFNESSVNTVRLPTFIKNGQFIPFAPFFRTGRAGSIVDNGGAGGVFAAIDVNSGIIISDGMDENNRTYRKHPDSNAIFKGFEIPHWHDLLMTAEKAHRKLADQRYIAWDFALTDAGWTLVEANGMGQFLWQYPIGIGVKKEFISLMND